VKILWIKTELLHPLDKGGRLRTYHTLRHLRRAHEIHYLALSSAPDPRIMESAAEYCHALELVHHQAPDRRSPRFWTGAALNAWSAHPYAIARYRSRAMLDRVRALEQAGAVDLIVSDFLAPSQNVPGGVRCPTILFQHNVEAQIWRRHAEQSNRWIRRKYLERQARLMWQFERRECRRFDKVIAVSEEDALTIRDQYGVKDVAWVPTGVDTDFFRPAGTPARNPRELLFTGSLDWLPNEDAIVHFVAEIFPLVQRAVNDVTFTIVGRRPSAVIRRLASDHPAIRLAADVPDVRPYLAGAGVFVVPLRIGGGTRLKIFEAMAMELPVVSTTVGAEGLPVDDGTHLAIGDSAGAFAARVVTILRDPEQGRAMAARAAAAVRHSHDWRAAGQAFTTVVEEVREGHMSALQPVNRDRA
jgi:polysaccharide biosynthesis protein PslH